MPTYEYICTDCRKTFSLAMSVREYEKRKGPRCPNCDSARSVQRKPTRFFALTSKKT